MAISNTLPKVMAIMSSMQMLRLQTSSTSANRMVFARVTISEIVIVIAMIVLCALVQFTARVISLNGQIIDAVDIFALVNLRLWKDSIKCMVTLRASNMVEAVITVSEKMIGWKLL